MSPMKSVSSYDLWKFVSDKDTFVSCTDGDSQYIDCRLGVLLSSRGMKLKSVVITNAIQTYRNIDDLHYLKARIIFSDGDEDITVDLRPYYAGDEDEWAFLMADRVVDDIDIRFTRKLNDSEPMWIAVVEGDCRTALSGDRMEWALLDWADEHMNTNHHKYDGPGYGFSADELYDLEAEAFDSDYEVSDSPYNSWRDY